MKYVLTIFLILYAFSSKAEISDCKFSPVTLSNTDDWEKGIVTQLWYREDYWETGRYVPYQVLMDNGDLVWIPRDIKKFIKKFDLESKIFYNLKHTEIDSDSSILQNSSMRKNTSFSITKRFSLYE